MSGFCGFGVDCRLFVNLFRTTCCEFVVQRASYATNRQQIERSGLWATCMFAFAVTFDLLN